MENTLVGVNKVTGIANHFTENVCHLSREKK